MQRRRGRSRRPKSSELSYRIQSRKADQDTTEVFARQAMPPNASQLLGPFIGNVNASTAMIWLQIPHLAAGEIRTVFVTLHEASAGAPVSFANAAAASYDNLHIGTGKVDQLQPDSCTY